MKYSDDFLDKAHKFCFENRTILMESSVCACFYCFKIFNPADILEWIDDKNQDTAMCPSCGIDAVLAEKSGLPITDTEFLKKMNERYFG